MTIMNASYWLDKIANWDNALSWSVAVQGKQAEARTGLGTYIVEVRPDNRSYQLRFSSGTDERVCPTRFTASNRIAWEAEDHFRRLRAQQQQPSRLKPPVW